MLKLTTDKHEASRGLSATAELLVELAYQETTFRTKSPGVWARGALKQIWDPLLISARAEARNFKFCSRLGLPSPSTP